MTAGRQLLFGFGVLVALQIVTSTVAIALLTRMSPAIEEILEDNVFSAETVEGMLAVLAESPGEDRDRHRRFHQLLERARVNVTEPAEDHPLDELEAVADRALGGDPEAVDRAVLALRELGEINRQAVQRMDDDVKRLGTAGAWAAALLGLIGLVASLLVLERSRRRLLAPMSEMLDVVEAQEAGNTHRRCTIERSGSPELRKVMEEINGLLDHRERATLEVRSDPVDRAAMLALLDERSAPWVLVGGQGELLAANQAAETALASSGGDTLREAITRAARGEDTPHVSDLRPVGDTGAHMCALSPVE